MHFQGLAIRPLLLPLFLLVSAPAVAADQIYIGGADGQVLTADAERGRFAPLAPATTQAITAMASDGENLFVSDAVGTILIYDMATGSLQGSFSLPVVPTTMQVYRLQLFVATGLGEVISVDSETGEIYDQRAVPTQVNSMIIHGDDLFVAGVDGAVYTAKAGSGPFSYFTCFCFTDIRAMTVLGRSLYVGDSFGLVGRVSLNTGVILNAFGVALSFNAMAKHDGDLLIHGGGGVISRVNRLSGQAEDFYFSPVAITTMLTVHTAPTIGVVEGQLAPRGPVRK